MIYLRSALLANAARQELCILDMHVHESCNSMTKPIFTNWLVDK